MNVKVSAGTLVTVTNWACGWIITFTFNLLMQWNASGKYSFDVYMSFLTTMFILYVFFFLKNCLYVLITLILQGTLQYIHIPDYLVNNFFSGTFLIFSSVSAASIVFIYLIVPETKGRSLEEIQKLLSNSVH